MDFPDETITAIASPPGGAARGIVRLSGPQAFAILRRFFRDEDQRDCAPAIPVVRSTILSGQLNLPDLASPLPCEIYLWPPGRSYTGEAVAEIHTFGSPPLLEMVVQALCAAGARVAQPGEFTLRAFLAGRIDLTQAEAVLGVIDAADPAELRLALEQLAGGLFGPLQALRNRLIELLAHLEAGFDFPDEDLPFLPPHQLKQQLDEVASRVDELAAQIRWRGESHEVIRVVLAGLPNAGKSSLFNALVGRPGALVSASPGTTRDYLTATLDLDGVRCQLIDTAGMPTPQELAVEWSGEHVTGPDGEVPVEEAAAAMTLRQRRRAHVEILCCDISRPDYQQQSLPQCDPCRCERLTVWTKVDLLPDSAYPPGGLPTSSLTGEGIDQLRQQLRRAVLAAGAGGARVVRGTALRCGDSLRMAAECVQRAAAVCRCGAGEELIAAEIRVALNELGKVIGAVYTDDVLDRIFSQFCIGK